MAWCRVHAGEWDRHGHTERGQVGERFRYYARFYFMSEEDAEAFRRTWPWESLRRPSPRRPRGRACYVPSRLQGQREMPYVAAVLT